MRKWIRPLMAAGAVAGVVVAAVAIYSLATQEDEPPDLSTIRVEEGRVSCEMFEVARGYRYQATVSQELKDRERGVEPRGDPASETGFKLTASILGDVQAPDRISANIYYPEPDQMHRYVSIGDALYESSAGEDWALVDAVTSFRVPFLPAQTCNAVAPDLFLADLEATPEAVNGILATRYRFDELETDLPDRHPAFGPSSDMGVYVNTFSGDVWVAEEGGYIVKIDFVGTGAYDNGRGLELGVAYELRDVNQKVEVKPPI